MGTYEQAQHQMNFHILCRRLAAIRSSRQYTITLCQEKTPNYGRQLRPNVSAYTVTKRFHKWISNQQRMDGNL